MKYRKKPIVIEAFRYGIDYIPEWFDKLQRDGSASGFIDYALLPTLEGLMRADAGDYIILGIKNEVYPCKPDIFEMTYEKVE